MAEKEQNEDLRPPEFTFKDRVYRYNTDMTLGLMDILSDCIHEARQVFRKAMLDEVAAGAKKQKINPAALFNFQISTADIWHEISRVGKSARFVAACVATSRTEVPQLETLFADLPRRYYQEMFDFFCAGGDLWNLTMPGFSNLAAPTANTTASES